MEAVIVKQEEEDWTYHCEGTEAELDVKTEFYQDVDLKSACGSTVPALFNESPKIKQEPTDSFEEAVTSQENSALCSEFVCDTTIVKEEYPVTEAAVKENDVWLQRLASAQGKQEESLQHDVKVEYDKDEETAVAHNTTDRKRSIPVIKGSKKFFLVPRRTGNILAAANNAHKDQAPSQLPLIAKVIINVLDNKNSKINSIAQPPVPKTVATSIQKPVLLITKPLSKVFRTAKPCPQPKQIQLAQKTGSDIVKQSFPGCIIQPKTIHKASDIKNKLEPAKNNVAQRSVTINRILDDSVANNFMTPLIMTKKITPLVTNIPVINYTSPLVSSSCNTSPLERKEGTQAKEPRRAKQSQKLLNILEILKASKRAEAFKKVPRAPVGTYHWKSPVANVKPIPQKRMSSNPTSVKTKIREILTCINTLTQPIQAKATIKRSIKSIPISQLKVLADTKEEELKAFMRPCHVKLDRLKLLTCAVCRQQFHLKSQFVEHVFQHVRTPRVKPNVPCNICGKYYQQRYIKIHERKEHGPKKFWCDHCGKKCSDKLSLISHLIIHSDIKPYRCDVCKKRFRRKSNLLSHQQIHSEYSDKPYSCIICDKQFRRKSNLRKHSLYHLAVRPHQCKICYKQFCQLFHLERHILVHTGERPYACEICNMRFTRSSHRKRHMAVHISKKKYACKVCEKSFKERSRLEKHKCKA